MNINNDENIDTKLEWKKVKLSIKKIKNLFSNLRTKTILAY